MLAKNPKVTIVFVGLTFNFRRGVTVKQAVKALWRGFRELGYTRQMFADALDKAELTVTL
jgi:hypothetical protein